MFLRLVRAIDFLTSQPKWDHTGVLAGRVNGWPKFVPTGAGGKPDAKVIDALRYYDAVNFARRTKAAGIVAVGFIDPHLPSKQRVCRLQGAYVRSLGFQCSRRIRNAAGAFLF